MADTQEAITDIIAAMRDESHTGESSCLEWVGAKMRHYADRLEAAWKREKSEIEANALAVGGMVEASRATAEKSSVVGNCAKMREALKTVKRYLDGYTVNVLEMRSQVDAALSAPPRNCDRFATFNDAIIALADKRGWHDGKWNSERYCILAQWLFATAKPETEGGSDGNK